MTRHLIRLVSVLCVLLSIYPAVLPAADPCANLKHFSKAINSIKNWDGLYKAYKQYAVCEDEYIGEGFANVIVHLLATRWETLPECWRYAAEDTEFKYFILRHIDATDFYELEMIAEHAQNEKNNEVKEFSDLIAEKATKVMQAAK